MSRGRSGSDPYSQLKMAVRVRLCVYLISVENVNMCRKGSFRLMLDARADGQPCSISRQAVPQSSLKLPPQQQFTPSFLINRQHQMVELQQLFTVDTPPLLPNGKGVELTMGLLKEEGTGSSRSKRKYNIKGQTGLHLPFPLNSLCEYAEVLLDGSYCGKMRLIVMSQPVMARIEVGSYKHAGQAVLERLRRTVKRLRYNNFILGEQLASLTGSKPSNNFTLPSRFVLGGEGMGEVTALETKLGDYLLHYQQHRLTPQMMNYELVSIGQRNQALHLYFWEACKKETVRVQPLRVGYWEKVQKWYRHSHIVEEYRQTSQEDNRESLVDKLGSLREQLVRAKKDEVLSGVTALLGCQSEGYSLQSNKPVAVQSVEWLQQPSSSSQQSSPPKYLFVLAHGYQGSPDDLLPMANALKSTFRKSRYLLLRSYEKMMGKSLKCIGKYAAKQIEQFMGQVTEVRIVVIGHSMGGLVLRVACSMLSQRVRQQLYGFVSLGTPHLGYMQGVRFLIKAGIAFFSTLYANSCFQELAGKDTSDSRQSYIFELAKTGSLGCFTRVMLVASEHDHYVSQHSARIEPFRSMGKQRADHLEAEMIWNMFDKGRTERVDRVQVCFEMKESGNIDRLLGRVHHIKMVSDGEFVRLLTESCMVKWLK